MKGGSVGMYKETFLEIDFSTRHITLYQGFAGKRIINKLLFQLDISFFVLYAIYDRLKQAWILLEEREGWKGTPSFPFL